MYIIVKFELINVYSLVDSFFICNFAIVNKTNNLIIIIMKRKRIYLKIKMIYHSYHVALQIALIRKFGCLSLVYLRPGDGTREMAFQLIDMQNSWYTRDILRFTLDPKRADVVVNVNGHNTYLYFALPF